MLLRIYHQETEKQHPDRLIYHFSKFTLRHKLGKLNKEFRGEFASMKHRFSRKSAEKGAGPETIYKEAPPGDAILAILSRGGGVNYLFKLPMLHRSGLTVVIGALDSLHRDPTMRLVMKHRHHSSVFFRADQEEKNDRILATDVHLGGAHLVYLPPENLKLKRIVDELNHIISRAKINTLVIDHIQRISEWNQEFNPSYLRLPDFIGALRKGNPEMTVLAFTAASDPLVKRDVLKTLAIREGNIDSPRLYRSNLSFQVSIAKGYNEKMKAYEQAISKDIPKALKKESLHEVLREGAGPVFGDDDILYQYQSETQKIDPQVKIETKSMAKSTPFVIHVSMMESIESWFRGVSQAGRDGSRGHCVQIVDIPEPQCEEAMRRTHSYIPACAQGGCPYGREELCHYGEKSQFIAKGQPDIIAETLDILRTMDLMLLGREQGDAPALLHIADDNEFSMESALYRLQRIGVIDSFIMDYKKQDTVFEVSGFNETVTEEKLKESLLSFLMRHDITSGQKYSRLKSNGDYDFSGLLTEIRQLYGSAFRERLEAACAEGRLQRFKAHPSLYKLTAVYSMVALNYIHEKTFASRYLMLWNLKEFIRGASCRYAALLKHFQAIDEDWRCGYCDLCRKTLDFDRPLPPTETAAVAELRQAYRDWLEKFDTVFDLDTALKLLDVFRKHPTNTYLRSVSLLEKSPGNIKALYLAREFAPAEALPKASLELIRTANRDLDLSTVMRLYNTSADDADLRRLQIEALDDEFGVCHTEAGEQWLAEEAHKLSLDPVRTRILNSRYFINKFKKFDLSGSQKKLNQLIKEW